MIPERFIQKSPDSVLKPLPGHGIFGNLLRASFLGRPNRFAVECLFRNEKIIAYLPNPGRLWELLFPGSPLYLVRTGPVLERKTDYICIAVEKEGVPVMLHTHHTNRIVQQLIECKKIPGLEGYRVVRPEVNYGKSRFDFLLQKDGSPFMLEVKSCTLFGREIAMFPDAATMRGVKHIEDLAHLTRSGGKGGMLFLVHWPFVRYFMPEYHTDLSFSRSLFEIRREMFIKAVSVEWNRDLTISRMPRELSIPWSLVGKEAHDRGSYIAIFKLEKNHAFRVGKLGHRTFKRGYYLYAGSAMKNLTRRMNRHRRRRKRFFWHIDYLREKAAFVTALPVRTEARIECEIARNLGKISDWSIEGFGASDCSCGTHLFGMRENPITSPLFVNMLLYFRIDRLNDQVQT